MNRNLLILFITCLFSVNLSAQMDWKYESWLTDTLQSGEYPDLVADNQGNLHLTAWNSVEDKLYYGFKSAGVEQWTLEYIDSTKSGGYRSAIALDDNGIPCVAYIENVGGLMKLHFAKRIVGNWNVEVVHNDSIGNYGTTWRFASGFIQASLDLIIDGGVPVITFFDGIWNLEGTKTGKLRVAYHNGNQWNTISPPYDFNPLCWQYYPGLTDLGDGTTRTGEFCKIVKKLDNKLSIFTTGANDAQILRYDQDSTGNYENWTKVEYDSVTRISPLFKRDDLCQFTYEGMDAVVLGDSSIGVSYGLSILYGRSSMKISNSNIANFFFTRSKVSGGDTIYKTLVGASNHERGWTQIVQVGDSDLYILYCERDTIGINIIYSQDSGKNWSNPSIVASVPAQNMPVKLVVVGDMFHCVYFDNTRLSLMYSTRAISNINGVWNARPITFSQKQGDIITGAMDDSGKLHIAYTDPYNGKLFYAKYDSGTPPNPISIGNQSGYGQYSNPKLALKNNNVYVVYADLSDQTIRYTTSVDNWLSKSLVTSIAPGIRSPNMGFGILSDKFHLSFHNPNERSLSFYREGGAVVDVHKVGNNRFGEYSSLVFDNSGLVHITYSDRDEGYLRYAVEKVNGGWETSIIDTVEGRAITWNNLQKGVGGKLGVSYLSTNTANCIYYAENEGFGWKIDLAICASDAGLGGPIKLQIDDKNRPWIAYNTSGIQNAIRILHRNKDRYGQDVWYNFGVVSQGLVADGFDFFVQDSHLYLAARKTKLKDTGIAILWADMFKPDSAGPGFISLTDRGLMNSYSVYPNPTENRATVGFELQENSLVSISLIDISGKEVKVLYKDKVVLRGKQTIEINIAEVPSGIYFCKVQVGDFVAVSKLAKL